MQKITCWAIAALFAVLLSPGARGAEKLTLIYISADDCIICTAWERPSDTADPSKSKSALMARPEAKLVEFRTIRAFRRARTDAVAQWPDDLRWIRDNTNVGAGTPRFLLVSGDRVLMNTEGTKFLDRILARIRSLSAQQE